MNSRHEACCGLCCQSDRHHRNQSRYSHPTEPSALVVQKVSIWRNLFGWNSYFVESSPTSRFFAAKASVLLRTGLNAATSIKAALIWARRGAAFLQFWLSFTKTAFSFVHLAINFSRIALVTTKSFLCSLFQICFKSRAHSEAHLLFLHEDSLVDMGCFLHYCEVQCEWLATAARYGSFGSGLTPSSMGYLSWALNSDD